MCLLIVAATFMFFFFNDTATTEIYTLSLHDALPISGRLICAVLVQAGLHSCLACGLTRVLGQGTNAILDRQSTRLNSSHLGISYAVFFLQKKTRRYAGAREYDEMLSGDIR